MATTKQQQTAETAEQVGAATTTGIEVENEASSGRQPGLTIGRIVHFMAADGSERAAIVTWVYGAGNERPGEVDLAVFTTSAEHGSQGAIYGVGNASYDASGQQPNTWHWPMEGTPRA